MSLFSMGRDVALFWKHHQQHKKISGSKPHILPTRKPQSSPEGSLLNVRITAQFYKPQLGINSSFTG